MLCVRYLLIIMVTVLLTALAVVYAFPVYIYKHSGNFTIGIVEYHCECCGVSYLYYLGNKIIGAQKVVIYATSRCGKITFEIIAHELTHSIGHVDSEYVAEYIALYITYRYFDKKLPLLMYLNLTLRQVKDDIDYIANTLTRDYPNTTQLVEYYYKIYSETILIAIKNSFTIIDAYDHALIDLIHDLAHGRVKQYMSMYMMEQIAEWSHKIYRVWLSLQDGEQATVYVR